MARTNNFGRSGISGRTIALLVGIGALLLLGLGLAGSGESEGGDDGYYYGGGMDRTYFGDAGGGNYFDPETGCSYMPGGGVSC